MSADQYIVTVFSFKKPYPKMANGGGGSHSSDMDSSFSSLSNQYGPPLDYSFRNISSLEKLERNRPPRQSLRKNRRSPSGRYNSNVIRLANNNLVDTTGLYKYD